MKYIKWVVSLERWFSGRYRIPEEDRGGDPGDSPGDAGR